MILIYLILAFLLFLGVVAAQSRLGWKMTMVRIAGVCSFFLCVVAFIAPFFMTINVNGNPGYYFDVDSANRLAYVLSGVIGFSSGVTFLGLGLALLEFARQTNKHQTI